MAFPKFMLACNTLPCSNVFHKLSKVQGFCIPFEASANGAQKLAKEIGYSYAELGINRFYKRFCNSDGAPYALHNRAYIDKKKAIVEFMKWHNRELLTDRNHFELQLESLRNLPHTTLLHYQGYPNFLLILPQSRSVSTCKKSDSEFLFIKHSENARGELSFIDCHPLNNTEEEINRISQDAVQFYNQYLLHSINSAYVLHYYSSFFTIKDGDENVDLSQIDLSSNQILLQIVERKRVCIPQGNPMRVKSKDGSDVLITLAGYKKQFNDVIPVFKYVA